jgi:hypothetical protein
LAQVVGLEQMVQILVCMVPLHFQHCGQLVGVLVVVFTVLITALRVDLVVVHVPLLLDQDQHLMVV